MRIPVQINLNYSLSTQVYFNLVQTQATTGCRGTGIYSFGVTNSDSSDAVDNNFSYSAVGDNTAGGGSGFTFGPNNLSGSSPSFVNPIEPSAPSCGNSSSVPNCMATLIAGFTPTTAAAKSYGYQTPTSKSTYDPLFPQWLCNVNLPSGLVTMGCMVQSSRPAPVTITSVIVN